MSSSRVKGEKLTNAQFCDIHPNKESSLIRGDKSSVSTIVLQTVVREIDENGKKISWTRETKLHACAQCVKKAILEPAMALEVELEYDEYRLTQKDGKYSRINRSPELAEATPTPLNK